MPGDKEALPLKDPAKQSARPCFANGRPAQTGLGAPSFFQYQRALRQNATTSAPVPSRVETWLALLLHAMVIASVFAPWAHYQTQDDRVGHVNGTATDANLVIPFSIMAIVSLTCVLVRTHTSVASMIGFVTSLGSFILAGATWMLIDSVYVADPARYSFGRLGSDSRKAWGTFRDDPGVPSHARRTRLRVTPR